MRPAHARAICHRQRFCLYKFFLFPIVTYIRHKAIFRIDILFLFPLWHKVIVEKHAGDWNLCIRLSSLIQTSETIVANLIWV